MPTQTILASRRTILLTTLVRHEQFLREFDPERDSNAVEIRLNKVQQLANDLENIQQQLEDASTTVEESDYNDALRQDFEPRLIYVEGELKAKMKEISRNEAAQQKAGNSSLKGIKLPTITLPEFNGDYMQWLTFRDTFECLIHDNVDLPAIQKFHYLRAALKGEAAQVIEAITISAANYDQAWKMVTARYSNEYLLKKRHLQAMFSMKPIRHEGAFTLHQLVDEFERHKNTLHHLGEDTDAWSSILEHLLCTKLPTITLRDWEEHASNDENPSYENLFHNSAPLDLILGARHYHEFFQSGAQHKISSGLPVLIESVFGWAVSGSASYLNPAEENSNATSIVCMSTLEESLERFWNVEELQPDFNVKFGQSKATALRRFELLERRLERDPQLKADYHQFMKEYLNLGPMSPINVGREEEQAYYLPHHPVFKSSSSTTKLRVVFDGSAKMNSGYSLNEILCTGPIVQDDLLDIILRFPPMQIFELNTVTYGLSPSSFLATHTLLQLADDEGAHYSNAQAALKRNFYVDDFIGGANTVEDTVRLRQELSDLLAKGGFELRKWTSNHLGVLSGLSADQIGTQSSLQFIPNETVKTLGISWQPESDELCFDSNVCVESTSSTKRSILSGIAKMYDSLGLIAPVLVRAKLLMQELWLLKSGWDDPVPEQIYNKWTTISDEWQSLATYKTNRHVLLPDSQVELHTFTDASEAAYGACIYASCENEEGEIRISLLASKSLLAPLKRVTLPRLELNAAVLGAHLHHRVLKAMQIDCVESFFWSDSTVTLKWIASPPNTWKTFVANRVAEVQRFSHPRQWRHVPGSSNPADLVSRGMSAANFIKSRQWHSGPDWLAFASSSWPSSKPDSIDGVDLEIRQVSANIASTSTHPWFDISSSYSRLVRIIGYCVRFTRSTQLKARTQPSLHHNVAPLSITPEHLEAAKTVLCRLAQQDAFAHEIKHLTKGEALWKQSSIRKLSPFIDETGVIRVGGRLKLSQLPYQSKHPVVLPKQHKFTRLMAEHYHEQLMHAGGRLLLSQMREQYWPLDGRRLVKSIVLNCFRCIRQDPALAQQPIGQLPSSRITPSRPFSITGVDYAGPFYLKPAHRRAAATKSYLCIFVCFTTKAVHLELVRDLTTAGFLAALRRFTSRRDLPSHIHSDNGKNFEGAERELRELFQMFDDEQQRNVIVADCANKGITWHFTPPKAPNFGGLWEAAVKTAKRHLYRHLGGTRLSYEGYCTVLQQIEAAMNSRPLLPLSDDPDELAALTPAHFLIGTSMHAVPEPDYTHLKSCTLDDLQKWQLLVQRFWKHWATEYLQEMQKSYTRPGSNNNNILTGRLVILMDESLPTTRWPLARIIHTHPGEDQIVRVVTLKTAKGIIKRPITKICILPLRTDNEDNTC
ncbi:uncharacterized protein LOC126567309 [Anopheles maculipalpis]|uniref:uncharacterized protein LOC126567309 n=1 Tax=Anopheles maculipalpis TaxID=1496333 RepID=UPI0021591592|nr:uncharacterized protein LOC126567309 [Anopheles maculipalpis]